MVLEDLLSFVSVSHLVSFFLVFLVEYVHACINGNVVLPLVEEFHPVTFGYAVDDQWNCIQKKSLLCCQTKSRKRQPFPGMKKMTSEQSAQC
jgi:hypothetical protein